MDTHGKPISRLVQMQVSDIILIVLNVFWGGGGGGNAGKRVGSIHIVYSMPNKQKIFDKLDIYNV